MLIERPYYEHPTPIIIHLYLVKSTSTNIIILCTRYLNDISIIINVFTLLLEDESFKEFCQDTVCGEEFNDTSIRLYAQDFGNKIGCDFLWLSSKDSEWELAKLWIVSVWVVYFV